METIDKISVRIGIEGLLEKLRISLRQKRIVMIPEDSFISIITNRYRVKILTLLSKGPLKASEISRALKITRTLVYKYLKDLMSKGLVEKEEEYFKLSSAVYLVYRVSKSDRGIIFEINRDRAIFIDERYGLIFVSQERRDLEAICRSCSIIELCAEEVGRWARRSGVDIDFSKFPAQNIVNIISQYVYDRIEKYLEKGYVIIGR